MTDPRSTARRLRDGTDADRILACALSPLWEGATAREIAFHLQLPLTQVAAELDAIAVERAATIADARLHAVLLRASDMRTALAKLPVSCRPDVTDVAAMLEEALNNLARRHEIMVERLAVRLGRASDAAERAITPVAPTERPTQALKSGNKVTGGARPPEQSRGALGPRNPSGVVDPV